MLLLERHIRVMHTVENLNFLLSRDDGTNLTARKHICKSKLSTFCFVANAISSCLYDSIGKIACLRIFQRFQRSHRGKSRACSLTFIAPSAVDDGNDSGYTRFGATSNGRKESRGKIDEKSARKVRKKEEKADPFGNLYLFEIQLHI